MLCAIGGIWPAGVVAQELTPRAYWPTPLGARVVVLGYSHSTGDVLFDPTIPLYGVDSTINSTVVAYLETFRLRGRTSTILVEAPYSWGTTRGVLVTDPARGEVSGLGDLGLTLAVNLLGAPSMTVQDFQRLRAKPPPILGASLKIVAPTGNYDANRLINVGANRWAVRASLGYIVPVTPKWLLEFDAGAWFFQDDDEFISGSREQDPIFGVQAHAVRRFRPGFWAALDFNYYTGGRQTIGGNRLGDVQRNSRLGATVVVPIGGRQSIKVGYAFGLVTSFGTDFEQFRLSYQVVLR